MATTGALLQPLNSNVWRQVLHLADTRKLLGVHAIGARLCY